MADTRSRLTHGHTQKEVSFKENMRPTDRSDFRTSPMMWVRSAKLSASSPRKAWFDLVRQRSQSEEDPSDLIQ